MNMWQWQIVLLACSGKKEEEEGVFLSAPSSLSAGHIWESPTSTTGVDPNAQFSLLNILEGVTFWSHTL